MIALVDSVLVTEASQLTTPIVAHTTVWPVVVYAVAVLQLIAGLYLCRARSNVVTTIVVVAGFFVCLVDLLYFGDALSKQLAAYSMACAFVVLPTTLKPMRG
jgi:hypothetical protein